MKINDVVFLPVTVLETYGGGVEADVEYVIGDDVIPIFGVPAEDLGEARALLIRALTAQAWAVACCTCADEILGGR